MSTVEKGNCDHNQQKINRFQISVQQNSEVRGERTKYQGEAKGLLPGEKKTCAEKSANRAK